MQKLTSPPAITDYGMRSVRITLAEQALNRADLTGEQLRETLAKLSPSEQPGDQIDHVIEAWGLWDEIVADSLDTEDAKEQAHWVLMTAIRELVEGSEGRARAEAARLDEMAGHIDRMADQLGKITEILVDVFETAVGKKVLPRDTPPGRHPAPRLHIVKPEESVDI